MKNNKENSSESRTPIRKPNMIFGLDIGTTKIVMVAGYLRPDGKIEVCNYAKAPSCGVEFGSVINVNDTVEGIVQVKNSLEEAMGVVISEVFVGVAGRHISSTNCSHQIIRPGGNERVVEQSEIDKMTRDVEKLSLPNQHIIAVIPQKYMVGNNETIRPVGTLGEKVSGSYQVITGNYDEIRGISICLKNSNLQEQKLILEPMASGLACLKEEEKKQGVALVDIGGGTTDIVIYVSGVPVFTKVIPVGGQVVTNDIASLGIAFEQAENLKVNHGTCIVDNANKDNYITIPMSLEYSNASKINEVTLAKVINARVEKDILGAVKREIIQSGYESKVKTIVLTGGGSGMNGLRVLSEYVLQKSTRIGLPSTNFNSLDSSLKDAMYSTALGLLKYGCVQNSDGIVGDADADYDTRLSDDDEEENIDKENGKSFIKSLTDGLTKFFQLIANEKGVE